MNWYVLYTISYKTTRILNYLNKEKELIAFIPGQEIYMKRNDEIIIKPMFNNYIFVKTDLKQDEFNDVLRKMNSKKDGIIRQLKNEGVSALKEEEIAFFNRILDDTYIARLSYGYQEDGRAVIVEGPLKYYEDRIVKVSKYNSCAFLDLTFFDRKIVLGLHIKSKDELKR